jgi:hypothetical protein
MITRARFFACLLRLFAGVFLALPLACLHVGSNVELSRTELAVAGMVLECPVGSEGCPCTPGGGCDPGLTCVSGYCSYSYGGDAGMGDEEIIYEFEDDLAYESPAPTPMKAEAEMRSPIRGRWGDKLDSKRKARQDKRAGNFGGAAAPDAASTSGSSGGVAGMPTPVDVAGNTTPEEPSPETSLAEQGRQVIYTATLQVSVFELDPAIEFAENLTERYGGWIESRYDYTITLRVPAEHLFEAIEQLSALGIVLGKTLQADDVTAEYTDLESRILILEHIVAQLEMLLKKATSVEEALKIRVELDRMRIELEAARARMRQLSEMIDFSTLTLYLSARGPDALPSSNDPFPWVDSLGTEATEWR